MQYFYFNKLRLHSSLILIYQTYIKNTEDYRYTYYIF